MRSLLTTLLLVGSTAHAVPGQFTHQGRLFDADGAPLEGATTIIFRVADSDIGGLNLWEETLTVSVSNGFYSAVLGTDEEDNPLDVEVLSQAPVWLEIQIDGEAAMSPRSAIQAVPYATMATVAEEVSGGPVDASQIAVGGTPVVNEAGEWVGPSPLVNWTDIEGVPADFADGVDDDTDSLADLAVSCVDGDIPVWDAALTEWTCGWDQDTLADIGCMEGQLIRWSEDAVGWVCGDDADTVLTEEEVDGMVADNGYAMATALFSGSFSDLTDVPPELADGDQDTLAATACGDGETLIYNLTGGTWACGTDSDTTLTASEVRAMVEAVSGLALAAGAMVGGSDVLTDADHGTNPNAHQSSTSDGLDITPASVTIQDSSTTLTDGSIDLGSSADDALTAVMVQTLTGGGDAESLHTHAAASGGGGGCYTNFGSTSCASGYSAVLLGSVVVQNSLVCVDKSNLTPEYYDYHRDGVFDGAADASLLYNVGEYANRGTESTHDVARRYHVDTGDFECAICCGS